MTKKNTSKRALLSSVLALVLCLSMLVGTTFAWFTDEVKSAKNQIVAGNLDVELEFAKVVDGQLQDWATVKNAGNIFDPNALWEPGRVEIVYLKVSNLGTLALKYQLGVNVYNEITGTNVAGQEFKLSDHLVFKVINVENADGTMKTFNDREAVELAAGTEKGLKDYNGNTTKLEVGGEDYVALIVYMPESVGNEANYRGTQAPTIELGVNLYATQVEAEKDSFGDDYDEDAWHGQFKVYNADDLQDALDNGETNIVVMDDIETDEPIIIPAPAASTFSMRATPAAVVLNLNGKKIVSNSGTVIRNEGNLVIKGKGTIESTAQAYAIRVQCGSMLIDTNELEVKGAFGAVSIFNGANVTINGGSYYAAGIPAKTSHTIYMGGYGTLNINGGSFYRAAGGDSGGVIVGYGWENEANEKAVININGGFIDSEAAWGWISNYDGKWTVITANGGTFGRNPSSYLAEGYQAVQNADGTYTVSMKSETLNDLFTNVQDGGTVVLPEGTYTIPAAVAGKDITIEGIGDNTVIDFTKGNNVGDASITFKNLKLQGKNANVMNGFGIHHTTGDIVYENCTFDGAVTNEYYGTVTYRNCTFTGTGYITTYAVKSATFENCVFDKADSRAVLVYSHGNNPCVVTLTNCTFKAAAKGHTGAGDWTAAVEIDTTNIQNAGTSVTITDCKHDDNYSAIVRDKSAAGKANAVITVDGNAWAFQAAQLAAVLTSDREEISVVLGKNIDCPITSLGTITGGSGEYKLGGENTEKIVIDLNGKKLNITTTYWSAIGAKNNDAVFTIKNGTMTSTGNSTGTWNGYNVRFSNCNYVIENVTFEKSVALDNAGKTATLKNVTINETTDKYALWITAEGQTVTIDGLTVNCGGRGIKIDEQYVDSPAKVTLKVSNAKFTTVKKAAILVESQAGAAITLENIDISNVAEDTTHAVWVDSDATAYADKVTVTGGTVINEP